MEEFDYKIKIENSPFEIEKSIKVKSMKLSSTPKVADFKISFKNDSTNNMLYNWMKSISEDMNENTVFDTLKCQVLIKPYPYKSKKKRLVKKWWDKHSEIRVYKNVKLNFGE